MELSNLLNNSKIKDDYKELETLLVRTIPQRKSFLTCKKTKRQY